MKTRIVQLMVVAMLLAACALTATPPPTPSQPVPTQTISETVLLTTKPAATRQPCAAVFQYASAPSLTPPALAGPRPHVLNHRDDCAASLSGVR